MTAQVIDFETAKAALIEAQCGPAPWLEVREENGLLVMAAHPERRMTPFEARTLALILIGAAENVDGRS